MRQRGPNIMKQWGIFFGGMILLHVVWFIAWALLLEEIRRSPSLVLILVVPYLIALTVLLILFFRRIGDASAPPEYHEAEANGLPATAKVLDIKQTRWHTKRRTNFRLRPSFHLHTTPRRWEYEMRVRVSRPGLPDYEAELADYLEGDEVPKKGDVIDVKVHPQRPEVVVMALARID